MSVKVFKLKKRANVLDIPRAELDPKIWTTPRSPLEYPSLQPEMRELIVTNFMKYISQFGGYLHPEKWIKNMFYTGSTATVMYRPTSDVDIHIIVDWKDMIKFNPDKERAYAQEAWKDLMDTFWFTLNKISLPGTKHPLTYYIMKPGEEDKLLEDPTEVIYDIGHDVWLFGPYSEVKMPSKDLLELATQEASDVMKRLDSLLSAARKDVIDYKLLEEFVNDYPTSDILTALHEKLLQINETMQRLREEHNQLMQRRQNEFKQQNVGDRNYTPDNLVYKLVERYKFMDMLRAIQKIIDGRNVKPDQIDSLEKVIMPGSDIS
jgi:predicted nucleotidyltransferase